MDEREPFTCTLRELKQIHALVQLFAALLDPEAGNFTGGE